MEVFFMQIMQYAVQFNQTYILKKQNKSIFYLSNNFSSLYKWSSEQSHRLQLYECDSPVLYFQENSICPGLQDPPSTPLTNLKDYLYVSLDLLNTLENGNKGQC